MSGQPSKLALALNRAISSYQAGQLGEAEQICQKIISKKSNFFDAHHVLGVILAAHFGLTPGTSGPGPPGAAGGSTKPDSVTTGAAVMRSPNCRCSTKC